MVRNRPMVRLVRLLPQVSKPHLIASVGLTLLQGALPVAFVWVSGRLIGAVPAAIDHGFDSAEGRSLIAHLIAAAAIFVTQQVAAPVADTVTRSLARRTDRVLRARTMTTMAGPPGISHLEDPALQDLALLARGVTRSDMTPGLAVLGLFGRVRTLLTGSGATWLVARYRWWLGLLLAIVWLLFAWRVRRDLYKVANVMTGNARTMRRSLYYRDVTLQPGVAKEARIFGLRHFLVQRFEEHWLAGMREVWRERRGSLTPIVIGGIATGAVYLLVIAVVARDLQQGAISIASLSIVVPAALEVSQFGNVGNFDYFLAQGLPVITGLADGQQRVEAHPARVIDGGGAVAPDAPQLSLRFEDVTFSYPGNPAAVYDGLSLDVPVGRSLAIVGPNGAGKTTLVKLLARLYEPSSGRIEVDGVDLRDLDARAWQRRIAAIFQDFVQYPLTARENVGLGAIALAGDEQVLRRAALQAGALEMIEALPKGWDTPLSRQFTDGADLSGGQWQRLALARAMFAVEAGAGVLVLDEPTANLDVRAEAELFDRFLDLTSGLTTILISHRFSTVRRADRICVLEGGKITEEGSHDDLLALDGTYARMFTLQAARFAEGEQGGGAEGEQGSGAEVSAEEPA